MSEQETRKRKLRKGFGIRWKLCSYMGLFAALVLLVTWFFQVLLLSSFFRIIKKEELRTGAQTLATVVGEQALESVAFEVANDHSLGVSIYQIRGDTAAQIFSIDAMGNPAPVIFSAERLNDYYQRAKEENGYFCTRFSFGGYQEERQSFWQGFPFGKDESPQALPQSGTRLIGVQLAVDEETGAQYLLLLTASLQPLRGTVQIFEMQYTWIFFVVLLLTIVMSFFLYQRISRPIIQMTNSAKKLARGDYNTDFAGGGFRETRELADTLNYASGELSRLDKLQKELIANISHDLRTPLTMVKGYAEVMRDIPGENTPENLQMIVDETEHLSALVNDLLDLSRIQSGTRLPEKSVFDITEAVREVMTRYEAFTKHKGYTISVTCEQNAAVCADRFMILQVIYNLINNAINYTGEDKQVFVTQTVSDGKIRISVRDTGKGIPEEEQPLIWDSYYRGEKVHRRAIIGTGLGLSIVKEVLEQHSAAYGLESELGVGSSFWFELPIFCPDCSNTIVDVTTDSIEEV